MTCVIPQNQAIYQALFDKAASYPPEKHYQSKAYKNAAQKILTHPKNIYDDTILGKWYSDNIPGIGPSIEEFINNYISSHPLNKTKSNIQYAYESMEQARKIAAQNAPTVIPQSTTSPTPPTNLRTQSVKSNVYTKENPRRSRRNIGKPPVKYFTEDDNDDEQENEQDKVYNAIITVCNKKGWKYSDNLITEFEQWYLTASHFYTHIYDPNTQQWVRPKAKHRVAREWAMYYSLSLENQNRKIKITKNVINYCINNNIEYQTVLADKFITWLDDPANKNITCKNIPFPNDPLMTTFYKHSIPYCIKAWFSTLKKTIVF